MQDGEDDTDANSPAKSSRTDKRHEDNPQAEASGDRKLSADDAEGLKASIASHAARPLQISAWAALVVRYIIARSLVR